MKENDSIKISNFIIKLDSYLYFITLINKFCYYNHHLSSNEDAYYLAYCNKMFLLNLIRDNKFELIFHLLLSNKVNLNIRNKFVTVKYHYFYKYAFSIKYYEGSKISDLCRLNYENNLNCVEFCSLNHFLIILYLIYLFMSFNSSKDQKYLHYFRIILVIFSKEIIYDLINQLKIYFIYLADKTEKQSSIEMKLLKLQYIYKNEPQMISNKNKEFSRKMNFLEKARNYLKNGMIYELLEEMRIYQKFKDYDNILFFTYIFYIDTIESHLCTNNFHYYFSRKDTSNILYQLIKIEENEKYSISKLKNNFETKKKNNLISIRFDRSDIYSNENFVYYIYIIYKALLIENNYNFPNKLLINKSRIDYIIHILFLLLQLTLKTRNIKDDYDEQKLVFSIQLEKISKKKFYVKKLNNLVKNLVLEIIYHKDFYNNPVQIIKILRFNFKILKFRDIFCEKVIQNLNKLVSAKLSKLIRILFKNKDYKYNDLLDNFINPCQFTNLFNVNQLVHFIFNFKLKDQNNSKEEILIMTDIMNYIKCSFTFTTFVLSKLGKSRKLILEEIFFGIIHEHTKKNMFKYTNLCFLIEEFIFVFYIFTSLINCIIISNLSSKNIIIKKNQNINLGIEYLLNLVKLGFFMYYLNNEEDFLELEIIINTMLSFLEKNLLDERLLLGFYIYCILDESLLHRKIIINSIRDILKKKSPIFYENIQKIILEKETISFRNDLKKIIVYLKCFDKDYNDFNQNVEAFLKTLAIKDYFVEIVKKSKKEFHLELNKTKLMMKNVEKYIDFEYLFSNKKEGKLHLNDKTKILKNKQTFFEDIKLINNEENLIITQDKINYFLPNIKNNLPLNNKKYHDENNSIGNNENIVMLLKENRDIIYQMNSDDSLKNDKIKKTNEIKEENLNYSFDNHSRYLSDNSFITDNINDKSKITVEKSLLDFDEQNSNENSKFKNIVENLSMNSKDNALVLKEKVEINSDTIKSNIDLHFSFNLKKNEDKNNLNTSLTFTKKKYISIKFIFTLLDKKIKKRIFKILFRYNSNKRKKKDKKRIINNPNNIQEKSAKYNKFLFIKEKTKHN